MPSESIVSIKPPLSFDVFKLPLLVLVLLLLRQRRGRAESTGSLLGAKLKPFSSRGEQTNSARPFVSSSSQTVSTNLWTQLGNSQPEREREVVGEQELLL